MSNNASHYIFLKSYFLLKMFLLACNWFINVIIKWINTLWIAPFNLQYDKILTQPTNKSSLGLPFSECKGPWNQEAWVYSAPPSGLACPRGRKKMWQIIQVKALVALCSAPLGRKLPFKRESHFTQTTPRVPVCIRASRGMGSTQHACMLLTARGPGLPAL